MLLVCRFFCGFSPQAHLYSGNWGRDVNGTTDRPTDRATNHTTDQTRSKRQMLYLRNGPFTIEMQHSQLESKKKSGKVNLSNRNTISNIRAFFICSLYEKLELCCCCSQGSQSRSQWITTIWNSGWVANMCDGKRERVSQKVKCHEAHTSGNVIHFIFVSLENEEERMHWMFCAVYTRTYASQCIRAMRYVCSADASKWIKIFQVSSTFLFLSFRIVCRLHFVFTFHNSCRRYRHCNGMEAWRM